MYYEKDQDWTKRCAAAWLDRPGTDMPVVKFVPTIVDCTYVWIRPMYAIRRADDYEVFVSVLSDGSVFERAVSRWRDRPRESELIGLTIAQLWFL